MIAAALTIRFEPFFSQIRTPLAARKKEGWDATDGFETPLAFSPGSFEVRDRLLTPPIIAFFPWGE